MLLSAPPSARSTASPTAISVRGLRMAYDDVEAVRGVDLDVRAGEILALLGPNGAGKTTIVEILEGFRAPTAGDVAVLGADPRSAPRAWRERIGIVLQESSPEIEIGLTVRECLQLYAGYYSAMSTRRSRWPGCRSAPAPTRRSCPAVSGAGSTSRSR